MLILKAFLKEWPQQNLIFVLSPWMLSASHLPQPSFSNILYTLCPCIAREVVPLHILHLPCSQILWISLVAKPDPHSNYSTFHSFTFIFQIIKKKNSFPHHTYSLNAFHVNQFLILQLHDKLFPFPKNFSIGNMILTSLDSLNLLWHLFSFCQILP